MGTGSLTTRRIGATKSRSGCNTCKIRRVKCGEEKPSCLRCSTTGRRCEYNISERSPPVTPPSAWSPSHALSLSPNSGQRERRAFEYYFQHAAKHLAAGLNVDFWTAVVPQICRSEPAVWDAMIAISAMFECPDQCLDFNLLRNNYKQTHSLNKNQQEALTWYSRSMSSIHSQIERGTADPYISLISCILFICVENIQGRVEDALQLYLQGVRLVLDLRAQVSYGAVSATKAALLENTIIPLFLRLNTTSLTISTVQVTEIFGFASHDISEEFLTIDSARSAINVLAAEAQLFERDATLHLREVGGDSSVSIEMLELKKNLQARLEIWHRAYTNLCHVILTKSAAPVNCEPVLLAYHAAVSIAVSGSLTHRETVYDGNLADFVTIVQQASIILDTSTGPDGSQPPFSFEPGVGIPLFLTAMKCRDPGLRRRALSLLRQAPPVQGFFKCTPVAILAEKHMELEESYSVALSEAHGANVSGSVTDSAISIQSCQPDTAHAVHIPEEARISYYGVFRPAEWLPPGVRMEDISVFGRGPEQLFLEFARNYFDVASATWRPGASECVPLGP
ncbi:uncharacterized protein N7459_007459 [Penicillium hispanicum]|uniref:uncharacterized protein n=1 Tax=Penicillium hispanicum TaxID=1080232 RepID=UPI002541CBBE|nr:uncharacterized protein N7459_007459 [Penicillium hispanicum]KAJ5578495.1 hypothetical protein N7459_007459 [Penicillium hispanicum]